MLKLSIRRIDEKFHFIVRILHFTVNLSTYMPHLNFNIFCVALIDRGVNKGVEVREDGLYPSR